MMKTELISYLFLSYLTLFVSGIPQFTTCPSSVCLSQPVTYQCNSGADTLLWRVLDTNGDSVGAVNYTHVGATESIGDQFNTVLTADGSSLVSNITFTPTLNMNNYIVQCGAAGTLVNCSIVIAGIPTPARIGVASYGPGIATFMLFHWDASTSPCLSHYVLVTTSSMDDINYYNASASGNSLWLSVPSTNNTLYNYTVLTVDTGGRSSESPIMHQFIPNVPERVANLMLTQTDYPTDTNDTVNITVSWTMQAVLSPLPIVEKYYIIYNVSGVLQNATGEHYMSSRNLSGFIVGLEYTVEMFALNALGIGPTTSATITILATPPPPEISSTSTSVSSSNSAISSTSSITPSSSPTNQASPLSGGAIAGIVFAIIVLGVLVVLGIAIVCYVKKKIGDTKSSVAPPMIEAYNYAQVDLSAKSSSSISMRQVPPKPAKSISPEADNQVVYSAIQKSKASRNPPPQECTAEYADLDHSASSFGRRNQRPKGTFNQVTYSHVSHHDRRGVRGGNHGNYY